jgi:hypothetical protein
MDIDVSKLTQSELNELHTATAVEKHKRSSKYEIVKFPLLRIGEIFITSDGEFYTKTGDLTFTGTDGLERYIDPLTDRKIGEAIKPQTGGIDTSAKIVKE